MSKAIWWSILAFGIGLFALIIWYALPKMQAEPVLQTTAPAIVQPPASAEPQIRHPIARQMEEKPLPALDVSDATMKNAPGELLSDKTFINLFQVQDFVRRIVATVDNLPRKKIALRLMPLKSAAGRFLITGRDGSIAIGADNAVRYAIYLQLANALDTGKVVALYARFYPLFQQAYGELGYPKGYFNDRLIEVIDHLLATPDVKAPVRLIQPKVLYLFADPEIEALSVGQKLLIRVGSENATLMKEKLRNIRGELTRQSPPGSRPSVTR